LTQESSEMISHLRICPDFSRLILTCGPCDLDSNQAIVPSLQKLLLKALWFGRKQLYAMV